MKVDERETPMADHCVDCDTCYRAIFHRQWHELPERTLTRMCDVGRELVKPLIKPILHAEPGDK